VVGAKYDVLGERPCKNFSWMNWFGYLLLSYLFG